MMSTVDYKPDSIHVEKTSLPPSSSYHENDTKAADASHIEDMGDKSHHTPAVNIIQNPLRVSLLFILLQFGRENVVVIVSGDILSWRASDSVDYYT